MRWVNPGIGKLPLMLASVHNKWKANERLVNMTSKIDSGSLLARAGELIDLAKAAGADQADAVVVRSRSRSVSVRLGKVEGTEASESDDFALRVFIGQKVASVSANPGFDMKTLAERAVAMARVSPEDPFACLADEKDLATNYPDLDLFDDTEISTDALREAALEMEQAALDVGGVTNSSGAGSSAGLGGLVLVTSRGFAGSYVASRFGHSVSVIAGEGTRMERDYDFDSRLFAADLDDPKLIGRRAGERVIKRINPRQVDTGSNVTVVFDPRVARGFVGHVAGAINGASVARKTSFLRDRMGQQVLKSGLHITDDPLVVRGSSSRPFDGEGVSGERLVMIEDGILNHWFLSTSTGRELGLGTNGRGVRGGNSVTPASTNLALEPGDISPEDLIRSIGTGFYITELIGQGVNMLTGEYSRGATGFWIENGELAYPVSEVTIASNLKDMFMRVTPANDIDRKFGVASPTIAIEGMTLAGR
jgi:PmbA protein